MIVLSLKNVCYRYSGSQKDQVHNLSFDLKKGETLTVIGPNGAGKTTLIKLVLGLMKPSSGIIEKNASVIGYIPQKTEPHRLPITVNRFLHLSQSQKIDQSLIDTILNDLDLTSTYHQDIKTLSGGLWQRVLLARALLQNPTLLVLDEPLQGVDVLAQDIFYEYLKKIQSKVGILMVSHDLHMVMRSTNHVLCLNHHVCCHGKPEHIQNLKDFQNLFGTKNLSPYHHHHDHSHD